MSDPTNKDAKTIRVNRLPKQGYPYDIIYKDKCPNCNQSRYSTHSCSSGKATQEIYELKKVIIL